MAVGLALTLLCAWFLQASLVTEVHAVRVQRRSLRYEEDEEEHLGLEGQDAASRAKCMREKEERPSGLLESRLGATFPTKLRIDSINETKPKQAVCRQEGGCGMFTLTKPQTQEGKACVREVPKLIHFVWMDKALPQMYAKNIAAVTKLNPDMQIMLWVNEKAKDTSALDVFLEKDEKKRIRVTQLDKVKSRFQNLDIIEKEPNVGGRSDWIRLELVYLYGGIYMDTDAKPMHGFKDYGGVFRWPFVAYSDPKGYDNLCNCIFSAEKKSPLLDLTIKGWRDNHFGGAKIPSAPPFGCPVLTAAFLTYNQPEILMLGEEFIFKKWKDVDPVMWMSFDGSWIEKKEGDKK